MKTRSKILNSRIDAQPPPQVFHYTSPNGLIGILRSKKIWATNIRYLNDFNELVEASDAAENILKEMINDEKGDEKKKLLYNMYEKVGTAASRHYVCSFSEDEDSLSQWRAYCPPTGGYALGVPSGHLNALANEYGWLFVKCVYDEDEKYDIVKEIINSFLNDFQRGIEKNKSKKNTDDLNNFLTEIALNFQTHIAKIGGAIKNKAFKEEKEWRLISPSVIETNKNIEFREGPSGAIPYYIFDLQSEKNPNLTNFNNNKIQLKVGPTPQMNIEARQAAQYIMNRYLGVSTGHSLSSIPYKGW